MCKELTQKSELMMEVVAQRGRADQVTVENFIQNFKWDDTMYKQHKSLAVLGSQIMNQLKNADDRLKKSNDELAQITTKVANLTKKVSTNFMMTDLGDLVYRENIPKTLFVNTYGSEIMTSVLVVVPGKKVEQFKQTYSSFLTKFNEADFENWQKRTRGMIL